MPLYTYRCFACAAQQQLAAPISSPTPAPPTCDRCRTGMKRDYRTDRPRTNPVFPEHFNPSVGKVVGSRRQFTDELARKSDAMSDKLGFEHKYVPLTPSEVRDTIKNDEPAGQ